MPPLANFRTGGATRPPIKAQSLRDRIEALESQLQRQQNNRQSLGPNASQQAVPLHGLANAQAMAAVKDGMMPVFDAAKGQFAPGGPLFSSGKALAGADAPTGPFPWEVITNSFQGASAGGSILVPFLDRDGNPTPFANGLLGVVVSVGNASPSVISCGVSTAGYDLTGLQVDFFSTAGPVNDSTNCVCVYTAYGW